MDTQICKSCKEDKPLSDFYFRKDEGKYRSSCKKCKRVHTREEIKAKVNASIKVCKHCGIEKPIEDFQKAGGGKWTQPYCKPCDAIRKRKHWDANLIENRNKSRQYHLKTRKLVSPEQKEKSKKRVIENLKKAAIKYRNSIKLLTSEEKKLRKAERDRNYRIKNADRIKKTKKDYYNSKGKEEKRLWQQKMMSDVGFRITKNLRGRIYVALKRGIKSKPTMELLGCTIDEFKKYFESLFTEGMDWERYMEGGIHIDHKIPCAKFDLTDPEQQKICFHYTNLQPLWALDNLKKAASIL